MTPPRTHSRSSKLRVFISYRRGDAAGYAGRLYDSLDRALPGDEVFIDIATIEPGRHFGEVIEEAIDSCQVVLVVVGQGWLQAADEEGRRRLDQSDDFVRREISAAIARGKLVIPLLVQGASMPNAHDLPHDLQELTQLEALKLDDTRWRDDVERLVRIIRNERSRPGWPSRLRAFAASHRWPVLVAAAMGILLVIGLALLLSRSGTSGDASSTSPLPLASGSPPCADSYFEGIPSERFRSVEAGAADLIIVRPDQPKEGPIGLEFTDSGRMVGGIRARFFVQSDLFKVESVVDDRCRPIQSFENISRDGDPHALLDYDTLRIDLGEKAYILRMGDGTDIRINFVPYVP